MNQAFVLLGSNMGNKKDHLDTAIHHIIGNNCLLVNQSSVYKTAAWGNTEQDDFFNQVIEINTSLSAELLLKTLLEIETKMGRTRIQKWEPRIIDLDILFFNNAIIDTADLKVPHPYLHVRRFTLLPLHDIAPYFVHPVFNENVHELLANCKDNSTVEVIV
ncbi:MAG: 2-amino-4-hydroxy-6-hydroxymethyldihydropteridine diphosphokinase [Bacteroidota bacterium]